MHLLIEKFHKTVRGGPTYVCASCNQLWYKHSILSKYSTSQHISMMKTLIKRYNITNTMVNCDNTSTFMCRTCSSHLKKNKLPPCSTLNKMIFPEQGPLKDLNILEQILLAPLLPFFRIHEAPVGKQFKIHGNMVLVPSDLNNTVAALPRLHTNTGTIKAKLKRRLRYKHHVYSMNIRPQKLRAAISHLITTSALYKQYNITLN